jgi:hypothetical protein
MAKKRPPRQKKRRTQTTLTLAATATVKGPGPNGGRIRGGALFNASPLNTFAFNQAPTYIDDAPAKFTGVSAKGEAGSFAHEAPALGVSARAVTAGEAEPPPLPPSQPNSMYWDDSSTSNTAGQIAAWRQARNNPVLSTGGAIEPVPVPLESFPRVRPQPNLSRTAGPQLDSVTPIPDVSGLDDDEAIEVIKEWFLSNYEDPAQSTPRNDGEFLYIWGGPYDARDEIGNAFSGSVPEQIIEAAVRAIEVEGIDDWAPHSNRQRPEQGELADAGAANSNALHAEMLERIEELEQAIASLPRRRRRGIGDNNPPEPIEPEPLSAKELREIRHAVAVLKAQQAVPSVPSTEARAAVSLLAKFGDRLRSLARATGAYIGKQADNFITEAVKEAGKRIVQSPFWLAVIHQLPALADVAHRWLVSLSPPL